MALKSAPYYWLECDNCGEKAEYGDYSAWGDASNAIDYALDGDWTTDGHLYHCTQCPALIEDDEAVAG